jgi:hypothetical protein
MLEWLNNSNDEFIFNNFNDSLGYVTEKYNIITVANGNCGIMYAR